MRVGLVIYGDLGAVSGGYLYDRRLVEHLRARGDAVEILSLPWRDYARHLADNLSPAWLRRLRGARVDLLLQDELNHPSLALANRLALRGAPYPVVSIVHHPRSSEARPGWQNRLYAAVERAYLRSVDAYIANSGATAAAVEALVGRRLPRVVAPPAGDRFGAGLKPAEIQERAGRSGPLRVVFVGNLTPRKGLDTLLAALERLPRDIWRLEVIGGLDVDPRHAHAMARRVTKARLGANVHFAGRLPDDQLAARLASGDLLAVPSSHEGFGIVYLEGMGFGLPALATTSGGAAEIVTHGENGYLVAPGDVAALAGHLRRLATDRELLCRLSLAAQRRFAAQPGWEASMAGAREFLCRLTERG